MKTTKMIIATVFATAMVFAMLFASPVMAASPGDASGDEKGRPSDPNFWGEVVGTQAQADDGNPGIGEHSSDPVPGDDDNETPRSGVGNQEGDGPSGHGAIVACQDNNPDTPC